MGQIKMCYFWTRKVERIKFATIMANCVQNNLWKFRKRILKYTENNDICLRGFFCRRLYNVIKEIRCLMHTVFNCSAMSNWDCSRCISLQHNTDTARFNCRWCNSTCRSDLTCSASVAVTNQACPPPRVTSVCNYTFSRSHSMISYWLHPCRLSVCL